MEDNKYKPFFPSWFSPQENEKMQILFNQGKLGPRSQAQQIQRNIKDHNDIYARWVQPDAGSLKQFAIQRKKKIDERMIEIQIQENGHKIKVKGLPIDELESYKKVERSNQKPYNIKYRATMGSPDWNHCPHCHWEIQQSISIYCRHCKGKISFMSQYIDQPNYGRMKIAPHVMGCLKCPARIDNILLVEILNEDQLCVTHFDEMN